MSSKRRIAGTSPAFAARSSGVVPAPSIMSLPRSSFVRYGGSCLELRVRVRAVLEQRAIDVELVSRLSITLGDGRFDAGIVLKSTAA